ncbi:MAG: metallophosphoesterase, partial [Oscillospiraceae bacterium]|nr:metallophosphoesterase [Oscillospiraceae bacterium]
MKKIDVTHYKVNSDKVGAGLAIALVADLHCALFGQRQSDLTDLIRAKTPDLILMAGDIYHHFGKRENGHILIRECSEIARVYYTPGNHEKQNPDYKRILSEVAESGGIVLDNEAVITDVNGTEIVIAGGDESATIKKSLHIKDSNRERFRILVNHYPEQFRGFTEDFDLMTAG